MNNKHTIQRFCFVLRWLTIATGLAFFLYLVIGSFVIDGWDMNVGDGAFATLWHGQHIAKSWLILVASPELLLTLLFYFWLQALFKQYQKAQFFTETSMRCYLWLVWLSMGIFVYELLTPFLLLLLPHGLENLEVGVKVDIGEFFTLSLLIVILYVLRTAQNIDAENKAFV